MSGSLTNDKLVNVLPQDGGPPHQSQEEAALHGQGRNAFNSERPLDVQPTLAGKCKCPIQICN
jgi:hypothetical protein